ncbi:MAG: hypothetical protein L0Y38_11230 [Methylococcaceae bacterium]|nr:hypothetical protein [Methylococcaceae bacterium]
MFHDAIFCYPVLNGTVVVEVHGATRSAIRTHNPERRHAMNEPQLSAHTSGKTKESRESGTAAIDKIEKES